MPRNASGVYSLPESSFVAGTIIESAKVNNDLSDIATALTQSLATTGVSSMSGQFKAANGAVDAPGIVFSGSTTTGFYRSAADEISWAAAGAQKGIFGATGNVTFSGNLAVGGTFAVTGATIFTGAVSFTGAITASTITGTNLVITSTVTVGSNLRVAGDVSVSGDIFAGDNIFLIAYLEGSEISTPSTASANKAKLFVRDVSGAAEFAYINDAGEVFTLVTSAIVQRTYDEYTSAASISTVIPQDDSIPQSSEGTQILSRAITLRKSSNRVRARFTGFATSTSDGWAAVLFKNGSTDALAASQSLAGDSDISDLPIGITIEFEHAPGSVGPHTYSINVGPSGSGSMIMNGMLGGRLYGGTARATLVLEEINV